MTYGTLPSRFLNAIDSLPNPRAQLTRRGNVWEPISSTEFLRRVAGLSMALAELGVKPGDRVLFGKYGGTEIKLEGEEFLILREEEILAKLSGAAKAAKK